MHMGSGNARGALSCIVHARKLAHMSVPHPHTQTQEVSRACKEYKERLEESTAELTGVKERKQQLKVRCFVAMLVQPVRLFSCMVCGSLPSIFCRLARLHMLAF